MAKKKEDEIPICTIKGCGREQMKTKTYCTRCWAWTKYWSTRKKADRYSRYLQVEFWQKRMQQKWGGKS